MVSSVRAESPSWMTVNPSASYCQSPRRRRRRTRGVRAPTVVGGASLKADDIAGLVYPVVRVAPSVGGGADGVGDVGVGGDVLNGGGHCLVLSALAWWLVLPADVLIMLLWVL